MHTAAQTHHREWHSLRVQLITAMQPQRVLEFPTPTGDVQRSGAAAGNAEGLCLTERYRAAPLRHLSNTAAGHCVVYYLLSDPL